MKTTNISSIEESLQHIAIRLDEMTGNSFGLSQLHVTSDSNEYIEDVATQVSILGGQVEKLNENLELLSNRLEDIESNLSPLASISENLELIMMAYVESLKSK